MKYGLLLIVFLMALKRGLPQNIDILSDGTRVAYISKTKLKPGKQQGLGWQWAACLQFALNNHGISIAQEEVLQEHDFLTAQNISFENALDYLDGWQVNSFTLSMKPDTLSPKSIKKALAFDRPVIVLNQSENYRPLVLTAFFYHQTAEQIKPVSVVIRDPSKKINNNRREISWADLLVHCTNQIIVLYL